MSYASDALIDALERTNKKLEAENAKLRERYAKTYAKTFEVGKRWMAKAARFEAINAKLRELVRELYEDQCADSDQWKYRDRMRELGVEVD